MNSLIHFLSENPQIDFAVPESHEKFTDWREQFIIQETRSPAIICRPQTIDHIASLVAFLGANGLPFSVRGGGHDMFGRTQVKDGVTIDMRNISHINVDKTSQTARVGGGVINMDLHRELQKHDMTAAHAVTTSVGYCGWAIHGGYGLLSTHYGFGTDQIVGARVVDARGHIRDADEGLLTAIRGGGGSVGVVYELVIKIYPSEKVLAGCFVYESSDLAATLHQFEENYRNLKKDGIPRALSLYQSVMSTPEGKGLCVFLIWSSPDLEEGQRWVDKVGSLGSVVVNDVKETTILAFNETAANFIDSKTYGTIFCPLVYDLTSEVVDVIAAYAKTHGHPGIVLGIHELRSEAPREFQNSVFNARDPHFAVEILPMSSSEDIFNELQDWARGFNDALMKTDPANIYPKSYIPLTPNEKIDVRTIYGDRYKTLREAKEKYDPDDLFKHAIVKP